MGDRVNYEARSYQTALCILGHLSTDDVLHYLGQAATLERQYRPAWPEIVVAAGLLVGQDVTDPSANAADDDPEVPF